MKSFLPPSAWFLCAMLPAMALAQSSERAELAALRAQMQQLEAQLQKLTRQVELKEAAAAAPAQPSQVKVDDKGYAFSSGDAHNSLRLRALLQADLRQFFDDGGGTANNAFVLRRVRLISEGTLAKNFHFQFVPEFGGSAVTINEANLNITLTDSLAVRFGRFKEPIGLERLQSDSWTFFNERSIATNLTPDRDLGVQVAGDLAGGRVNYAVGVFNGLADAAGSNNTDHDDEKDLVGRVMATPFKSRADTAWRGLSLGIAGSTGRHKTASGRTNGYRTDGQQVFFAFNPGVVADGRTWRVAPQLDFRDGPFGLLGEYIVSAANVRAATGPVTEVRNTAGSVQAGYVLTGEASAYNGVMPRVNFDPAAGTWGAFEVTGRHAWLSIDTSAFPTLASVTANASDARSIGVGLNWYLSKAVAFKFDYYQTKFGFQPGAAPTAPVLQQDEKVFITRFQVSF
ncbi:MAG TPA: porin [Opitutaceae bacterium]|nr:porin [Opitutaceae bacterium]